MILPSAVSTWSYLVPRERGRRFSPGPFLSTAQPARRRGVPALNGSLTIIVLTPLTTFSTGRLPRAESARQAYGIGWGILIVMSGPARGRRKRAMTFRALLPCLALITLDDISGCGPNDDVGPVPAGPRRLCPPQNSPLRKINDKTGDNATDPGDPADGELRDENTPAPSRIGKIPTYGLPAANGAVRDRLRFAQSHAQETKILSGPGPSRKPLARAPARRRRVGDLRFERAGAAAIPPSETANKTPIAARDGRHGRRPAAAQAAQGRRRSVRRGRRLRRQLPGQVGGRTSRRLRHQSRPPSEPQGSPFWVVAPEFLAVSDWERHALVADLRGSFTGYGNSLPPTVDGAISPSPTNVDRPDFTGHIDGRLDVTDDTHITSEVRLRVATDNPGSPNIQAGLANYPIYTTLGGTFGIDQNFNRLDIAAGGTVDRTVYQNSTLTDGTIYQQRRPQLQPVWRRRPRQLRFDCRAKTVRRGRGRQPRARPARSIATAMRAIPPAAMPRPAPRSNSRGC